MIRTDDWVRRALDLGPGNPESRYRAIGTDTRTLAPGALFVALTGERYDGHDFLEQARDAGAAAAVVRTGTPAVEGLTLIAVPDTLAAYGQLARARRREIRGPVVAVTGTNGKTSTKELLAAALATRYRIWATRRNLNNLVGVPQTILDAPEDTEALVIEAGASLPGEIARYRTIIEPTIAIVTNVAEGHLEGFGSLDAVMREKLELVRGVPVAVTGTSPADLGVQAAARGPGRVVRAALRDADLVAEASRMGADGRVVVRFDGRDVQLPVPGWHQAENAALVWAVVRELGLDRDRVAVAMALAAVPEGRGELIELDGTIILHDCYNANPGSFRATIRTAASLREGRPLVFVAGTMRELGDESDALHRRVAQDLVALEPDLLAVVGEFVPAVAPWADVLGDRLLTAADPVALGPRLAARLRGGELVVLKASRGVALERILPAIVHRTAAASPSARPDT